MLPPHITDILRYSLLVLVVVVAALFGMSFLRKHREHKAVVGELRSITSDSSFYRQFYADDARRTLLRAMFLLRQGEKTGDDPAVLLDEALGVRAHSPFDRSEELKEELTAAQRLAVARLLANYEHCRKLGLLDDEDALAELGVGELPRIRSGPGAGQPAALHTVIDPALSPGIEKVLANLEIGPPQPAGHVPGDVELTAARRLARDLEGAGIIEDSALKRILDRFAELAPK